MNACRSIVFLLADVQLTLDGYEMSFEPSKQRSYAITKKFLVPKVEPWFSVFHEYMRRIQRDLKLSQGADVDLLWTGRSGTGVGESKFIKSPLGKDQVYNTPKYIAKRLGKKIGKLILGTPHAEQLG